MARAPKRIRITEGRMNIVGERVKERRVELQIKQDELCGRLADVTLGKWAPSRLDVYRIEHGARLVSDLELIAMAAVLSCSTAWLLHGDAESLSPAARARHLFGDGHSED